MTEKIPKRNIWVLIGVFAILITLLAGGWLEPTSTGALFSVVLGVIGL